MKKFKETCAQGDVYFRRIDAMPKGLVKVAPEGGNVIVTHSETGHHHVMDSDTVEMYQHPKNPLINFLVVKKPTDLVHLRTHDTHETVQFDVGTYQVHRQREFTLEDEDRTIED